MKEYLIIFESGKNNLAGCAVHLLKNSIIIRANNVNDALYEFKMMGVPIHYGHEADYVCVLDIKEI